MAHCRGRSFLSLLLSLCVGMRDCWHAGTSPSYRVLSVSRIFAFSFWLCSSGKSCQHLTGLLGVQPCTAAAESSLERIPGGMKVGMEPSGSAQLLAVVGHAEPFCARSKGAITSSLSGLAELWAGEKSQCAALGPQPCPLPDPTVLGLATLQGAGRRAQPGDVLEPDRRDSGRPWLSQRPEADRESLHHANPGPGSLSAVPLQQELVLCVPLHHLWGGCLKRLLVHHGQARLQGRKKASLCPQMENAGGHQLE